MANDQVDFELWLKSKFDGDALAAARAAFEKTKRTADDAKVSLDDLGYSAKNLKQMLAEVFAITELISQFKEGFEQVAAVCAVATPGRPREKASALRYCCARNAGTNKAAAGAP